MKFFRYILIVAIQAVAGCSSERPTDADIVNTLPQIYPDYVGVTIPATIAPLNFNMADEEASIVDLVIRGADGSEIHTQGTGVTDINADDWAKMLNNNIGDSIMLTISAKYGDAWRTYQPFAMYVSPDSIDYGLVYRLIAPGYELYGKMGIYQRSLSDYEQTAVLENTQVTGCLNCHSFNRCDPTNLSLHVRGEHGATLLRKHGQMSALNTGTPSTLAACVYPYWHPDGKYIAYSTNKTAQTCHAIPDKRIEVFDMASDVQVYDTETNTLLVPDVIKQDSVWETFPAFSPDGRTLYYCAARAVAIPDSVKCVRYDLCSVSFDPDKGEFGTKIDTLVNASAIGRSVAFPRPSFDGRWLMFTMSDYGTFPIWHSESDLWMLDMQTGDYYPLATLNNTDTESYHNWSSNSRWVVFSSRRDDGLYTRPYIAHIGADGSVSRPFMLPQSNPRQYYDNLYYSYNIPEFVTGPVNLDRNSAANILNSTDRKQVQLK